MAGGSFSGPPRSTQVNCRTRAADAYSRGKTIVNGSSVGFWKLTPALGCVEHILSGTHSLREAARGRSSPSRPAGPWPAWGGCGWGWREPCSSARTCEEGLPFTQSSLPLSLADTFGTRWLSPLFCSSGSFSQRAFGKSACFREGHFGWGNSGVRSSSGEEIPSSPQSFAGFMVLALARRYLRSPKRFSWVTHAEEARQVTPVLVCAHACVWNLNCTERTMKSVKSRI